MSEKKRCIRCDRPIDSFARICPFCNWDQSDLAVRRVAPSGGVPYVAPSERPWRNYALMAAGGVVVLVAAFALGSKIQGHKPVRGLEQQGQSKSEPAVVAPSRPAPRADVTLVPTNVNDTVAVEQPITSAPTAALAEGIPPEYQRKDATAVSSVEYAQLAARAQEEKRNRQPSAVDPRSLSGPAYAQNPPRERTQKPMTSAAEPPPSPAAAEKQGNEPAPQQERPRLIVSTRPVPEYQPIPEILVRENTTVRLQLTVGSDGKVKEINVLQGVAGQTFKIVEAVQKWRFRPATENGTPVSAPFTVDLSFRGQ